MILNPRWFMPTKITVVKNGEEPQHFHSDHAEGTGYQYEAAHVMNCLDEEKIESEIMTWQTSLDLMETLDRIRIDAGIFFPKHDKKLFF
jgi:hypothetical protein